MKINQSKYLLFLLIIISIAFTSCTSSRTMKISRTASFYPDLVRMDISTSDLEFIGEKEISISISRYFGVIRIFEAINDKEVTNRMVNQVILLGDQNLPLGPALRRALYDVYIEFPDADFMIPSYVIEERENLFLGRKVMQKALIKAYKLKI
ncbi:MAG: hypothetical protein KAS71_00055 [Bacteroidales bacterium]|nr:hypothetical protein [Bacteroidales bacterium]